MQKQDQRKILKLWKPDGHLARQASTLLAGVGYSNPNPRIYRIMLKEQFIEMRTARPLDIAISLVRGHADIAIVGRDAVLEFPRVKLLLDMQRPVTQLRLAVRDILKFRHIRNLSDFYEYLRHQSVAIYSEYPRYVWRYFSGHPGYLAVCNEPPTLDLGWPILSSRSPLTICHFSGCTEGNDCFVDSVEKGETLELNHCRPIHTLLERSTPYLAASYNALADPWKRMKIAEIHTKMYTVLSSQLAASYFITVGINTVELVNRSMVIIKTQKNTDLNMRENKNREKGHS